jgi:hypothetical protein
VLLPRIFRPSPQIATLFDDDGILVRFMNSPVEGNGVRAAADAAALLCRVQFGGTTPLAASMASKVGARRGGLGGSKGLQAGALPCHIQPVVGRQAKPCWLAQVGRQRSLQGPPSCSSGALLPCAPRMHPCPRTTWPCCRGRRLCVPFRSGPHFPPPLPPPCVPPPLPSPPPPQVINGIVLPAAQRGALAKPVLVISITDGEPTDTPKDAILQVGVKGRGGAIGAVGVGRRGGRLPTPGISRCSRHTMHM